MGADPEQYAGMFDGDVDLARMWVAARHDGDRAAHDEIVLIYGRLVRYVVSRMRVTLPPSMDRSDLVGFGTLGLIDAISRFDLDRGLTFQAFAVPRIRGAILDALRAVDWVPRSVRSAMQDIDHATVLFEQRHAASPTVDDLVQATGLRREEVRATRLAYRNGFLASLDERVTGGEFGRDVVDATVELPDETYDHAESQAQLRAQILALPLRDRAVVTLYYFEELTFAEIGRVLGVSESRACQVHGRVIKRLRAAG